MKIQSSELILRPSGAIYHLNLLPAQIATNIILVGDPERVDKVSQHFDRIDHKVATREFVTHTGSMNGIPVSVVSTGIGTDNIDIVLNELDALHNIDLETRTIKTELTKLNFIRIGTSGCMQADIPVDSFLVSQFALGMEGMMHYYDFRNNADETLLFHEIMSIPDLRFGIRPYLFAADSELVAALGEGYAKGITLTCAGFYGPQFRSLRLPLAQDDIFEKLQDFRYRDLQMTNFEMETAGIYGLSSLLGHRAISFNALLANRANGTFSQQASETVALLIQKVLSRFSDLPA